VRASADGPLTRAPVSGPVPSPGEIRPEADPVLARLRALLRRLEAAAPPRRQPALPALALETVATPHGPALRHVTSVAWPGPGRDVAGLAPGTVFLDTETTGLSGGTGTYVFLVGLATWTGQALSVTQYFLGDLGAEAAFLHAVREAIAPARELVTFNGRTFDLPLLETRYLLARAPWWGETLAHRDLYPVARALWQGQGPDCRLTTLEAALLGLDRGDDLPGALVPSMYFRFLRTGDGAALPRIFTHNRWDLVALAGLQARAAALLAGPDARHGPEEWVRAGRWLERRDPQRSMRFYEAGLGAGLSPALEAGVAWRLALLRRRAGQADAALALLDDVAARVPRPPVGLLVELAKLCEHHARDFPAALRATRAALAHAEAEAWAATAPDLVEALERRARRLTRRLAGRVHGPGGYPCR
jgi:hypothetical protein